MEPMLPDRECAKKKGWRYQVQWMEDGKPCFYRFLSGMQADWWLIRLQHKGLKPIVIDLVDALQLEAT